MASFAAVLISAMRTFVRAADSGRMRGLSVPASDLAGDFDLRGGAGIRSFQRQSDRHHETRIAVAELDGAMVKAGDRRHKAQSEAAARL